MFCKFCGNEIDENAVFCSKCGKAQEKDTVQEEDVRNKKEERPPRSVGWATAIKNAFLRIFDYNGRSVRSEYWWLQLTGTILSFVVNEMFSEDFYLVIVIILAIVGLPCMIRRLHDTGKSGWYYFITFIPLIGGILLLVQLCKDSDFDNEWGLSPYEPPNEKCDDKKEDTYVHKWRCKCGNIIYREPCKFCGYDSREKNKNDVGYLKCMGCGLIIKNGTEKCACGCSSFDVAPNYKKCEYCGEIVPTETERCNCGCLVFKA